MGTAAEKLKTKWNKHFPWTPDLLHLFSQNKQYIGVQRPSLTFVKINYPNITLMGTVAVPDERKFRIRFLRYEMRNNVNNGK